jgi:hypothetical protein
MAVIAYRLQIVVILGATLELRHLVIYLPRRPRPAIPQAGLAQPFIPAQDAFPSLLPLRIVTTALTATTARISELADVAVCLVLIAVT